MLPVVSCQWDMCDRTEFFHRCISYKTYDYSHPFKYQKINLIFKLSKYKKKEKNMLLEQAPQILPNIKSKLIDHPLFLEKDRLQIPFFKYFFFFLI